MRFFVLIIVSVLLILEIKEIVSDDVIMQKSQFYDREAEPFPEQRKKRPFCNAFTGCGRKRSEVTASNTLYDINSESAIDELTRRILSRAKFLLALEEARNAIFRNREDGPIDVQEVQIPYLNYIRRKRCANGSNTC